MNDHPHHASNSFCGDEAPQPTVEVAAIYFTEGELKLIVLAYLLGRFPFRHRGGHA
ncbi:hypothetical protein [Aurantimonas coralicida]|uniref:hypothetical protein n=1 Tax=Aurantimonas coralicida TaxID=182270 RepID=UPI0035152098